VNASYYVQRCARSVVARFDAALHKQLLCTKSEMRVKYLLGTPGSRRTEHAEAVIAAC
jgi:hypothetical protein